LPKALALIDAEILFMMQRSGVIKRLQQKQESAPKNKYNLHKIPIKFGNF